MNRNSIVRNLLVLIAVVFLTGCASRRIKVQAPSASPKAIADKLQANTLPTKPQPTLTKAQIQELDSVEAREAEQKYLEIMRKEGERLKSQPKVTNVFTESDLKQVLLDLATQTKTNIIIDESVQGTVSAAFNEAPLETALTQVLSVGGFKFRRLEGQNIYGNNLYYVVGKAIPENMNFNQLSITKVVKTNQEAVKVAEQISDYYKPYVFPSKTGNSLTLTGPPDVLDRLEWDIAQIDRVKRQIEISARFVLVQWEKGTNLGMQWGDINLEASGLGNFLKGSVPVFGGNLAATLSNLLEIHGFKAKVNIVAEPRIVIEDGTEGELKIAREDLFLILSGGGSYYNYFTTKEVFTGVVLKVQPFVSRDGMLRLILKPEISDIIGEREFKMSGSGNSNVGQKLPIIARRGETTTVRVENGKTIAIGGLLMQERKNMTKGIPGALNVPVLGSLLFGGQENSSKDSELVIFITSRIIG